MKLCFIILWGHAAFKENIYVVPNHFTERWWGTKMFPMFKMGYDFFKLYEIILHPDTQD